MTKGINIEIPAAVFRFVFVAMRRSPPAPIYKRKRSTGNAFDSSCATHDKVWYIGTHQ